MGQIYTQTKTVRVDLMPSAGAYAIGDVIGTTGGLTVEGGKIPLLNAFRHPTNSGVLQSLFMYDEANQKPALTVMLFSQKPEGDYTDSAKPSALDGDSRYFIGQIAIAAADWATVADSNGSRAFVTKTGIGLVCGSGAAATGVPNIYAVFISGGTPDWAGAVENELSAVFGFLQD